MPRAVAGSNSTSQRLTMAVGSLNSTEIAALA
jgi:hypothetical protein